MTRFHGFVTKEEAKAFQKKNGGMICGKNSRIKQAREYWLMAVNFGGMAGEKYSWCVQWNDKTDDSVQTEESADSVQTEEAEEL